MSDHNGNGSNGNGRVVLEKTGVKTGNGHFAKGFDPRRGHGLKGRSGRTRSEVRDMLVAEFAEQMPLLKRQVAQGKLNRLDFANLCAKYGLGTTVTETDTEGRDVTVRVIREPQRLNVHD